MPTLISTTGYSYSGSSAAADILQEFNSVKYHGTAEINFLHYTDGLSDLENILSEGHPMKIDLAVKRFLNYTNKISKEPHYKRIFNNNFYKLVTEYINNIIKMQYSGWWPHETDNKINKNQKIYLQYINKIIKLHLKNIYDLYEPDGWRPTYFYNENVYYEYLYNEEKINDFINITKEFTNKLLQEAAGVDGNKYILLEQIIPSVNISKYTRYFNSYKLFLIDRDPRDIYIGNKVYWGEGYIPSGNVQLFIDWYLSTRKTRNNYLQDKNILFIPFESLIYEYNDSINKIINFLEISTNEHIRKKQHFNPDLSIKNTQLFLNYPEYDSDIKLIEEQLKEYCYNFPYNRPEIKTQNYKIELINQSFNDALEKGKLPKNMGRYHFPAIISNTKFFRHIQIIKHNKKYNKNYKNKSLNPNILIKLIVKFFFLPFDFFYLNLLLFFNKGKKHG